MANAEPSSSPGTDCFRCGYDLRETPDDKPCPECGLLAIRSRRPSDEIRYSHPRWITRIANGSKVILSGILASVTWMFASENIADFVANRLYQEPMFSTVSRDRISDFTIAAGMLATTLPITLGLWLITSRDRSESSRTGRLRRTIIRLLAFAPPVALILAFYLSWETPLSMFVFFAVTSLVIAATVFLLFRHLGSIAARARSAHLAEHCTLVAIGSSAAFVLLPLFILLDMNGARWLGEDYYWNSNTYFISALIIFVLFSLFVLWSLYLFTRFAIAFHRESRRANMLWKRDDMSEPRNA